jgi:hypothetical protein
MRKFSQAVQTGERYAQRWVRAIERAVSLAPYAKHLIERHLDAAIPEAPDFIEANYQSVAARIRGERRSAGNFR